MKRKHNSGFTVVEMLCAVVVLLLVSMGMVTGVRLAVNSYAQSVATSEAQVLCDTLTAAATDKLRSSGKVQVGQNSITFFCEDVGNDASFSTNEVGQVTLGDMKLLPNRAYPYGMKAQILLTKFDTAKNIFSVEITVWDKAGTVLATNSFQVECLNPNRYGGA